MNFFQVQGNKLKEEFNFGKETLRPNLPFVSTILSLGLCSFEQNQILFP